MKILPEEEEEGPERALSGFLQVRDVFPPRENKQVCVCSSGGWSSPDGEGGESF